MYNFILKVLYSIIRNASQLFINTTYVIILMFKLRLPTLTDD
jgi:hypothetical protein